jgi:hypothetical protein
MKKGGINLIMLTNSFYDQVEPRRRQEQRDSEMMPKSTDGTANMPQQEIDRTFNASLKIEHFYNPADEKY